MSYTSLYIAFLICSILLVNCLVILARFIHQVKKPPADQDFDKMRKEKEILETTVLGQNEEIVELQLRIKEFEEQAAREAQEKADAEARALAEQADEAEKAENEANEEPEAAKA